MIEFIFALVTVCSNVPCFAQQIEAHEYAILICDPSANTVTNDWGHQKFTDGENILHIIHSNCEES